ncbi:MAG: DUF433 domain-containing protein [Candidatus Scalinduaceae bacterium]
MYTQRKLSARSLEHPYVSIDPKVSQGSPTITGTRIRIIDIAIEYDRLGLTPDQIIDAHPHLNLEAVHDALSYYYENRESIDKEIRKKKKLLKKISKKNISILKETVG